MRGLASLMFVMIFVSGCAQNGAIPPAQVAVSIERERSRQTQLQALQSAELTIPYATELTYPENWVEITRRRQ